MAKGTGIFSSLTCPSIPGRPGIVQGILSNVFYKSDFETIFETSWLQKNCPGSDSGVCSSLKYSAFFK